MTAGPTFGLTPLGAALAAARTLIERYIPDSYEAATPLSYVVSGILTECATRWPCVGDRVSPEVAAFAAYQAAVDAQQAGRLLVSVNARCEVVIMQPRGRS